MKFVQVFINLFQFNRRNWKAIVLCFLAAAIFWLFTAFNKTHTTTLRFPLRFEFDNERFVAIKPLPRQIRINVSGSGWELFRKTLGIKLPELLIPLEQPLDIKKIPATALTPVVASQLGGLQINYMVTDTLHMQLDEKKSKTFRISIDISKLTFQEGFGSIGQIKLVPDSVVIDGPKSIINAIPDTISLPIRGTQISKSWMEELEVPLYGSESINRNPPVVEVHITVGQVETIETMVKVNTVNQSRTEKSLITDSVKVLIRIPLDQREDLMGKLSQVNALVDLKHIRRETQRQSPKIIGLPIYAQVVSIDSVSFKIDKRN
jgi:hypothetical protein